MRQCSQSQARTVSAHSLKLAVSARRVSVTVPRVKILCITLCFALGSAFSPITIAQSPDSDFFSYPPQQSSRPTKLSSQNRKTCRNRTHCPSKTHRLLTLSLVVRFHPVFFLVGALPDCLSFKQETRVTPLTNTLKMSAPVIVHTLRGSLITCPIFSRLFLTRHVVIY